MNSLTDERVHELLKSAMPGAAADAPAVDLWPSVRSAIDRAPNPVHAVDYALIALVVAVCLLRPSLIEILLLHL